MRLRNFIGSSAALLLVWLGITYFYDVPAERYPTQGRPSSMSASKPGHTGETSIATLDQAEIERQ